MTLSTLSEYLYPIFPRHQKGQRTSLKPTYASYLYIQCELFVLLLLNNVLNALDHAQNVKTAMH